MATDQRAPLVGWSQTAAAREQREKDLVDASGARVDGVGGGGERRQAICRHQGQRAADMRSPPTKRQSTRRGRREAAAAPSSPAIGGATKYITI